MKINSTYKIVVLVFSFILFIGYLSLNTNNSPIITDLNKSAVDKNIYRFVKLKNGLEIFLVQMPANNSKISISMSVGAGSTFDPKDYQGLSHLLEHSLFLGNKKYPTKNSLSDFLNKNGGSHNAYTSHKEINYFISVDEKYYNEALDRFAHMFMSPLFDQKYISKERNIVESEYRMGLHSIYRKFNDVLREVTPKNHPYHKLAVGNVKTLADKKDDVSSVMHKFFANYYHSGNMKLAVASSKNIDEMEILVRKIFADINSKSNKNTLCL